MLVTKSFRNILIFGRVPPPVGGVTASVKNLVEVLADKEIEATLFDYKVSQLSTLLKRYDFAHINSSSPIKRLMSLLIGKVIAKKVVFVIHGNRFVAQKWINHLCLKLASGVIVLNLDLYESIQKSSFESKKILLQTSVFRKASKQVISNQFNFLKNDFLNENVVVLYSNHGGNLDGKEVYGLTTFLSDFIYCFDAQKYVFVIVDLDGTFKSRVHELQEKFRLLYYDEPVDFGSLLKNADIYIRPTNFDGSSVAVLEALECGVSVIASDVVDRPDAVIIYKSECKKSFCNALEQSRYSTQKNEKVLSKIEQLFEFYDNI